MPSMWERNIVSFYIRDVPFATRSVPFGIYIFHSQSIVKSGKCISIILLTHAVIFPGDFNLVTFSPNLFA